MRVFPTPPVQIFSGMVKGLFYGLKTIGLAPFSIQFKLLARNSDNTSIKVFLFSRMGLLYNFVLATLIQIMGIVTTPNLLSPENLQQPPMHKALDSMMDILHVATNAFILVYLGLRQKRAAIIMNRLLNVHFLLSGPKEQLSNKSKQTFTLGKKAFYIVPYACSALMHASYNFRSDVLLGFLTHVITSFFLLEYCYILEVVARNLELLNQNLSNLQAFPSYLFDSSIPHEHLAILSLPSRSQLATLKLLHDVRTTLLELSQEISEFFSLPTLLSVACAFVSLIDGCYWSIMTIFILTDDFSMTVHIDHVLLIVVSVIPIVLLTSNVTKTVKKARLTGRIVHVLLATTKKPEIITELEQFSLHLIHEKINFTAYGFFKLDFTLLQSIFGATATYLVIVFQFVKSAHDEH